MPINAEINNKQSLKNNNANNTLSASLNRVNNTTNQMMNVINSNNSSNSISITNITSTPGKQRDFYVREKRRPFELNQQTINITDSWEKQNISYKSRLIDNQLVFGSAMSTGSAAGGTGAVAGDWWGVVQQMGAWYQENVHTYQGDPPGVRCGHHSGRKAHPCPLCNGQNVFDDCSSFCTACVCAFGKGLPKWHKWAPNTASMQKGSEWDTQLQSQGFKYIPFDKSVLQQGDIYCGPGATHTEICAGKNMQYGWGSVHDGRNGKPGMPCSTPSSYLTHGKPYLHIWRYGG